MAEKRLLANELRQKADILTLRFDGEKNAWYWEKEKTVWAGITLTERRSYFSSIGIGAREAEIVLRATSELTLHRAMRSGGKFFFLTSIIPAENRMRLTVRAAVCESMTLTAKPQSRKGRDAMNRPVEIALPGFTFPGILTERYYRNDEEDFYRAEVQQRALVTPREIVLRAGDLVQQGEETPYTVRQVLDLDPFRNEYVIERRWEA